MKKKALSKYIPKDIESKWQKRWDEQGVNHANIEAKDKNYYMLVELPYTSGDLHMGHWFTFTYGDVLARLKRMQGYNVLFPNGFDAFGLPAENAAIKRNIHPKDWTYANMDRMRKQFDTLGTAIDWRYTMVACDPGYYKWNQWIFLKLLEKGLAYRAAVLSNWCPSCQTVLANENVESGKCWRCGSEVVQKEVEQWFFKITDYADRLIWKDPPQADWPKSLRVAQNDWIGKSEGVEITFEIKGIQETVTVFTTKPETIDGATFIVLAPEHPLVNQLRFSDNKAEVMSYVSQALAKQDQDRLIDAKKKTGVDTGYQAVNPVTGKLIPLYIADYVLGKYGTGAVMGVPFADERDKAFATAYDLPIIETSFKAKPEGKKKVQYHLHDWSISRQRYWGTPVPIINCEKCGEVPVPEKDLPVELPYEVDYVPKGKPPLASNEEWFHTTCPKCGGKATRDPETLDTFIDSAWYFFRYLDPDNSAEIFSKERAKHWMPLDVYIGGPEHTFGHALYSRFITMFLKDLGLIDFDEYAKVRLHHGTILGPDGARMSKSKGNVVNPDEEVKKFGADAIRVYLSFLGPFDITTSWNPNGVYGIFHFLQRIWDLQAKVGEVSLTDEDLYIQHKTIKKVGEDISNVKYNTAIAAIMEWLNHLSPKETIAREEYITLLQLLAPFAPHITEELWESLSQPFSIHTSVWPVYNEKYLVQQTSTVVVQVNGKMRDSISLDTQKARLQDEVEKVAKQSPRVAKFLEGVTIKKVIFVPGKLVNFVA
jgi:leucyl-tRNA synthetase